MPEVGPEDLWIYIYEMGEVRYTDLVNKFVKAGKCAKQTLLNYKRELESEGKVKKRLSERTRRPVYYVPKELEQEVRILIERQEMMEMVDKLTPEELVRLRKEVKELYFGD